MKTKTILGFQCKHPNHVGLGWCMQTTNHHRKDHLASKVRGRELRHSMMTIPSYLINVTRFQGMRRMPVSYWWRLTPSPASRHELLNMKLSRAWEPEYKEGAWRNNLGKRSLYRVHCRDIGRRNKARFDPTKHRL